MKLDIKKEKQFLSSAAKKVWDMRYKALLEAAENNNLDELQTEALVQMDMAQMRYVELHQANQYNEKSGEVNSLKAINKNKAKMFELQRVYSDNLIEVKDIDYQKVLEETNEKVNNQIQNEKSKSKNK